MLQPDFHGAMDAGTAKHLYEIFFQKVGEGYNPERVKDGVFQAMMQVALVNDGPVFLLLNLRYAVSSFLTPGQVTIELFTPQKTERSPKLKLTKLEKSKKAGPSEEKHEYENGSKV